MLTFIAKFIIILLFLGVLMIVAGAMIVSAIAGGIAGLCSYFFGGKSHTDDID